MSEPRPAFPERSTPRVQELSGAVNVLAAHPSERRFPQAPEPPFFSADTSERTRPVKFDVTSSDGAGNGWDYEDGTLLMREARERIRALNADGWRGMRTAAQRWYTDQTLNSRDIGRTLRTVFTHDHFGPSAHQQSGRYAGQIVDEDRPEGRPAGIWTSNPDDSFTEFLLEFSDFSLVYEPYASSTGPAHATNKSANELPGSRLSRPPGEAVADIQHPRVSVTLDDISATQQTLALAYVRKD